MSQQKPKVLPEDYLELKKVGNIISNRDYVVWTETTPNQLKRTYTSKLRAQNKSTGEIKYITSGSDSNPEFFPEELGKNRLIFLSRRSGKNQVYLLDLDFGGEAEQLTSHKNGVTYAKLSPDGSKLVFLANIREGENDKLTKPNNELEEKEIMLVEEEEERKIFDPYVADTLVYREGTAYHDQRKSHVYVYDFKTNEHKRVSRRNTNHWSPLWINEKEIIATAKIYEPTDLNQRISLLKFDLSQVKEGGIKGNELLEFRSWNAPEISISPNGKRMTLQSLEEGTIGGQNGVHLVYDFESNSTDPIILDRAAYGVQWKDDDTVQMMVDDTGRTDVREYSIETKEIDTLIEKADSITSFSFSDDEVFFTATGYLHYQAIWTGKNSPVLLEDPNQSYIDQREIVVPEERWFKAIDGSKFQGWYFSAGENSPLALDVHGGPHAMWNGTGTMWHQFQCLVSAGYSVLATNPRGSAGYGQEFAQSILGEWGVNDARDLLNAVDEISKETNPSSVVVLGGSYAGFQTMNLIGIDKRFKAAVAQRGVYDFITFPIGTDIPLWFYDEIKGTPWDDVKRLWDLSPLSKAKDIETPVLIIASEKDFRVQISQSEEMYAALKYFNKPAVFVRYPRDGHELSRSGEPSHVVDRLNRIIDWFNKYVNKE